jgi:hypothetical protein
MDINLKPDYIMKKIIMIAAMVLGFAVAATAQPRALGAGISYGVDLRYQHTVAGVDFIEADLGLSNFNALNVAATYNFMIAQPAWTAQGEWGFYVGPGVAVGAAKDIFMVGAACQVGLEYTFDFPLQLSLDVRPQLGLVGQGFGIWGWYPHLGVRYRF